MVCCSSARVCVGSGFGFARYRHHGGRMDRRASLGAAHARGKVYPRIFTAVRGTSFLVHVERGRVQEVY